MTLSMILGALSLVILVGLAIARSRSRRATHLSHMPSTVPLVVFPPRARTDAEGRPLHTIPPAAPPMVPAEVAARMMPPPYVREGGAYGDSPPADVRPDAAGQYAAPAPSPILDLLARNGLKPDVMEGRTVRFYRPPEGTLQMLPGRLEIIEGEDEGHEIRFVRTRPGGQQVTFGRLEGPPYEHVQLRARTVSRQHARLDFEQGSWRIANLSDTNPVVVNGTPLPTGNGGHPLAEGDRIEMGEIVFRYRER